MAFQFARKALRGFTDALFAVKARQRARVETPRPKSISPCPANRPRKPKRAGKSKALFCLFETLGAKSETYHFPKVTAGT